MALPKWLTPAGNLGIVPELEYYEFPLDAYDAAGGTITFYLVSGILPPGIQINELFNRLQGIPISTAGPDQNESYTFTIRAENVIDFVGNITNKVLTVTSVGNGTIVPGQTITGGGITEGTTILTQVSGANGAVGTYTVDIAQTITSTGITTTDGIADRTFTLTITNIAPPVIVPKQTIKTVKLSIAGNTLTTNIGDYITQEISGANAVVTASSISSDVVTVIYNSGKFIFGLGNLTLISGNVTTYDTGAYPTSSLVISTLSSRDLGNYFDGTLVNEQLEAVEFVVEDNLVWSLKSGQLPEGVTLSPAGLLYGYIRPSPATDPSGSPGWDRTPWDLDPDLDATTYSPYGWDFPLGTTSRNYEFTIQVTDGINFDEARYKLFVYPKSAYKSDSTLITVDATISEGKGLTVDIGSRHEPIITTEQIELYPQRADNYFQFNFDAIDLDGDILEWAVPVISEGAFDQQILTGPSIDYIAAKPISGNLFAGAWPKASISDTAATIYLYTGNIVTANVGDYITQTASGANAQVTANVSLSNEIPVINLGGTNFFTSQGNLAVNGVELVYAIQNVNDTWSNIGVVPDTVSTGEPLVIIDQSEPNLIPGDIIQVLYENPVTLQDVWYTATVNNHTSLTLEGNTKVVGNVGDYITQTISGANAVVTSISASTGIITLTGNLTYTANVGDVITQTGNTANAVVTANVTNSSGIPVTHTSGLWTINSGNIKINGANVAAYPTRVTSKTTVGAYYNTVANFEVLVDDATAIPLIANVSTESKITSINSVGVTIGALSTQGEIGYDEDLFDQGTLELPTGLEIQSETGWLTGILPAQTINEIVYEFNVVVSKRDYPGYISQKIFTLTVLGDPNNNITWLTPENLGTIQNGKICDIDLTAISSRGKTLYYRYTDNATIRLPQGLVLGSNGILSGRVSFEVFTLDAGATIIDSSTTTFDNTYVFTVTAEDAFTQLSADRTFTIRVIPVNIKPYENLYLKALLDQEQRDLYRDLILDQRIFPRNIIYRNEDPNFGVQQSLKTLFLAGLEPSTLADYANAADNNHFLKRITFGEIKTAVAVDSSFDVQELATGNIIGTFRDDVGFVPTDFSQGYVPQATIPDRTVLVGEHTKYEVVYIEIIDENSNRLGQGPADTIDLTNQLANPYYDFQGNAYTVAYPNAFDNMRAAVTSQIDYANKGALPDWMISRQPDGRVLGFTRAVVLAYTSPGESNLIAYRLKQSGFKFNRLDFSVDRYQLDNKYTENYDIAAGGYLTSTETTFDRYPSTSDKLTVIGSVDYAISIPYESVNMRSVQSIRDLGGFDGIRSFRDGQKLIFAQQEYALVADIGDTYNQGWSDIATVWSGDDPWDWDSGTPGNVGPVTSDDLGWDAADYVTGYNEHNFDPNVPDRRIGIWQINISADNIVELEFVQEVEFNDTIYVKNGFTYGGTNVYYDSQVKPGNLIPNYSIIPQEIRIISTQFDGNGTRFLNYRDEYTVPESGDKYIKFAKTGVFT